MKDNREESHENCRFGIRRQYHPRFHLYQGSGYGNERCSHSYHHWDSHPPPSLTSNAHGYEE